MSWTPLNETYFVRPDPLKLSPLVMDTFEKHIELRTGIVVKAGTGTLTEIGARVPLQANIGDHIMYGAKAGAEVEVDGEKLLLLAEVNILAVEDAAEKKEAANG